jgi:soluble lytic murein transglycosylase-like protein
MSQTSFSFRNIFLGVLLGIAAVAGWAFYPQLQSAVETQVPLVLAKFTSHSTTDTEDSDGEPLMEITPAEAEEKIEEPQTAPPAIESATLNAGDSEPADPAADPMVPARAEPAPADPLEASPGWNPDLAKALIEPVEAAPTTGAGDGSPAPGPAAQDTRSAAVVEQPSPQKTLPAAIPGDDTHPPRQREEEASWQSLLALPFLPEQAADYPYGDCFKTAAVENRLPLPVVLGMAAYLSNFDPEVVSDSGAGILNVGWPRPAKRLGIEEQETLTRDACANISAGARHLASLLAESQGQWVPALVAYRRHVAPAYLGRIRPEDLDFSRELRDHVQEVIRQPYQPKTMYAFWEFDEQITARRFMKMVQNQSGVQLWMRQQGFSYVIYIPAADPQEKDRKLQLIEQETGLQAVLTFREDAPS